MSGVRLPVALTSGVPLRSSFAAVRMTEMLPSFAAFDVTVDGRLALSGVRVAIEDGRALLPLRDLAQALSATVRYDAGSHTVIVRRAGSAVRVRGARTIGGRAYAPLRVVAATLGAYVAYDAAARRIAVRTTAPLAVSPTPAAAAPSPTIYAPYPIETARRAPASALTPEPRVSPSPVREISIDRTYVPGLSSFDVFVRAESGVTGAVAIDGVNRRFPLRVWTVDAYVAHVVVPPGVYVPFAHVAARLTLPDGRVQTLVSPWTITVVTATPRPRVSG